MTEIVPMFGITPQVFTQCIPEEKQQDFKRHYEILRDKLFDEPCAIVWDAESEEDDISSLKEYLVKTPINKLAENLFFRSYPHQQSLNQRLKRVSAAQKIKSFEQETQFVEVALNSLRDQEGFLDGIVISAEFKSAIQNFDTKAAKTESEPITDDSGSGNDFEETSLEEGPEQSVALVEKETGFDEFDTGETKTEEAPSEGPSETITRRTEPQESGSVEELPQQEPEPDEEDLAPEGPEAEENSAEEREEE